MTQADPAYRGETFACQKCGAKVDFDAATHGLRCAYCGHQQALFAAAPGDAREIPIEEGYRLAQRGFGAPVTQVGCNECGATVNVTPGEQTTKCAFCGSHQVLPREASGQQIRPESMVPFRVDKLTANKTFEAWLGKLWLRPSDLKRMAKVHEMGGVYVPFWTFDAQVHSRWRAQAGYHYYETEDYTDAQGKRQTRQVQKTRWERRFGHRADFFNDAIVCASRGLPANLVEKFRTWRTRELIPYQPHYLAGWKAESYVIDLMPAWQMGQQTMAATQRSRCARDVPGDTHRNLEVDHSFSYVTFKHVLLPVWIAAYRYGGKPYRFLVNGQTGEVVGNAPFSFWKIFFLVVGCIAAIAAALLIMMLAHGGGGGNHNAPPPPTKPRVGLIVVESPAVLPA